jgi:hypothetical protein
MKAWESDMHRSRRAVLKTAAGVVVLSAMAGRATIESRLAAMASRFTQPIAPPLAFNAKHER